MWKGQAWVNGFNIGRYFLTPGQCSGACAPPIKSGHCYMHWKDCGKPTQTMYHVPTSILKQTGNLVTLFEETGGSTRAWHHASCVAGCGMMGPPLVMAC